MIYALEIPTNDPAWNRLPLAVKEAVRVWILAFESVTFVKGPNVNAIRRVAQITGKSPALVRVKFHRLAKGGDWRVFVDARLLAPETKQGAVA